MRSFVLACSVLMALACRQEEPADYVSTAPQPEPAAVSTDATATLPEPVPWPAAKRISLLDATAMLERDEAVLVDVRSAEAYSEAHARGAIHIPEAEILNRLADIPMGKTIITYCT